MEEGGGLGSAGGRSLVESASSLSLFFPALMASRGSSLTTPLWSRRWRREEERGGAKAVAIDLSRSRLTTSLLFLSPSPSFSSALTLLSSLTTSTARFSSSPRRYHGLGPLRQITEDSGWGEASLGVDLRLVALTGIVALGGEGGEGGGGVRKEVKLGMKGRGGRSGGVRGAEGVEAALLLVVLLALMEGGLMLSLFALISLDALSVGAAVHIPTLVRKKTETAPTTSFPHCRKEGRRAEGRREDGEEKNRKRKARVELRR